MKCSDATHLKMPFFAQTFQGITAIYNIQLQFTMQCSHKLKWQHTTIVSLAPLEISAKQQVKRHKRVAAKPQIMARHCVVLVFTYHSHGGMPRGHGNHRTNASLWCHPGCQNRYWQVPAIDPLSRSLWAQIPTGVSSIMHKNRRARVVHLLEVHRGENFSDWKTIFYLHNYQRARRAEAFIAFALLLLLYFVRLLERILKHRLNSSTSCSPT
jgi:hypothetical protein